MRLKLTLEFTGNRTAWINYSYLLSPAIRKILHFGSPEFSSFLPDVDYNINGMRQ
ncbi:MAG: hypothetical protein WC879_18340 [Melioribacteraceae bacterium]